MDWAIAIPILVTILSAYAWVCHAAPKTAGYIKYVFGAFLFIYFLVYSTADLSFRNGYMAAVKFVQTAELTKTELSLTSDMLTELPKYPKSHWPQPFHIMFLFFILMLIELVADLIRYEKSQSKGT